MGGYGTYRGSDLPGKGKEGQNCNRRSCQASPALYYNHGMYKWYCKDCARDIGNANRRTFKADMGVDHEQFETREELNANGRSV